MSHKRSYISTITSSIQLQPNPIHPRSVCMQVPCSLLSNVTGWLAITLSRYHSASWMIFFTFTKSHLKDVILLSGGLLVNNSSQT